MGGEIAQLAKHSLSKYKPGFGPQNPCKRSRSGDTHLKSQFREEEMVGSAARQPRLICVSRVPLRDPVTKSRWMAIEE